MPNKWHVSISYTGRSSSKDAQLAKCFGRKDSDGSGFGFGQRDVEFYCDTRAEARAGYAKVKKLAWVDSAYYCKVENDY